MFEFGRWSTQPNEHSAWLEPDCIRCGEAAQVDGLGYCGHCYWAVRAELAAGFQQLNEHLGRWARFGDWCAQRGQAIM